MTTDTMLIGKTAAPDDLHFQAPPVPVDIVALGIEHDRFMQEMYAACRRQDDVAEKLEGSKHWYRDPAYQQAGREGDDACNRACSARWKIANARAQTVDDLLVQALLVLGEFDSQNETDSWQVVIAENMIATLEAMQRHAT